MTGFRGPLRILGAVVTPGLTPTPPDMTERDLFLTCVAQPTGAREAYLSELEPETRVKNRVRRLIAAHEQASATLSTPPSPQPLQIGPYRILDEIGAGGMGIVYLAEQEVPLRRRVALKVVRTGLGTPDVMARFEAERQAMALMSHPAIARILDAGETDDGDPYFVMEHVRGERIDVFCDRHELGIADRIELFLQVCDGVQHAHQRGVIHRDLKPSNILVSMEGDRPFARVIDFGVAKAVSTLLEPEGLGPEGPAAVPRAAVSPEGSPGWRHPETAAGIVVGTPAFMSPEQATLFGRDIDTRTDVYALGMVLYGLLVDVLAFDDDGTQADLLASVRAGELTSPSERFDRLDRVRARGIARRRSCSARALSRALREDLDWIVLKALSRDREQRYAAASELLADLRLYLGHRPVAARPLTRGYSIRKLLGRHRIAAIIAGLAVAVTGALAGSLLKSELEVRHALSEAVLESERSAQSVDAIGGLFEARLASAHADSAWTERLIERGMIELERLNNRPAAHAALLGLMGRAHLRVGSLREGIALLEQALEEQLTLFGPDHLFVPRTRLALGEGLLSLQELDLAEQRFRQVRDWGRDFPGDGQKLVAVALGGLGRAAIYRGELEEARSLLEQAETIQRRYADPETQLALVTTLKRLMIVHATAGRWEEARTVTTEAIEIDRRILGREDSGSTADNLNNLGAIVLQAGDVAAADTLLTQSADMALRVIGRYTAASSRILSNLADVRVAQGRVDEAVAILDQVVEIRESEGLLVAEGHARRGRVLLEAGRHWEAMRDFERAIPDYLDRHGEDHHKLGALRSNYGASLLAVGRPGDALRELTQAVHVLERELGPDHRDSRTARARLGEVDSS